jgi:hypothetical protein
MGRASAVWLMTLALVGAIATPASAVQGTTPSGLIQDVNVSQTSLQAGQPTEVTITTALRKADNSRPSETVGITVQLPAGMARNTNSFATCEAAVLLEQGPTEGCPGSVIGTGSALSDVRPVVNDPILARVEIVNGTEGSVLLGWLPQQLGPNYVFEGRPIASSTIQFILPAILTAPLVPNAAIIQLTLDFSSGFLTNPPDCPTAGWTWGFTFAYASGENLSLSANVPCTGNTASPPEGKNRAHSCKAERARIGHSAFADKYGTNRNQRNAFGKCVSQSH